MKIELLRRTETPVLASGISSGYFWVVIKSAGKYDMSVWLHVRLPRVAAHIRASVAECLQLPARIAGSGYTQPIWCSDEEPGPYGVEFNANWIAVYYGYYGGWAVNPDNATSGVAAVWADVPPEQNRTRIPVTHAKFMVGIQPAAEYLCAYLRQIDETLSRTVMPP